MGQGDSVLDKLPNNKPKRNSANILRDSWLNIKDSETGMSFDEACAKVNLDYLKLMFCAPSNNGQLTGLIDYKTFMKQILPELMCFDKLEVQPKLEMPILLRLCDIFDTNHNFLISWPEFVLGVFKYMNDKQGRLNLMFKVFDFNDDKILEKEEMAAMLRVAIPDLFKDDKTKKKQDETIEYYFQKADINRDGVVSLAEFKKLIDTDDKLIDLFYEVKDFDAWAGGEINNI